MADALRCAHWLVGYKVGIPNLYDLQCARGAGHTKDHVNGMENWNDAAGEYRSAVAGPDDTCGLCHHEMNRCMCDADGHAYAGDGTSRCKVCGYPMNAHDPALGTVGLDGGDR
ncbi:MAG TPA: hypothetical protein VMV41_16525 [Cellulomonadaceae bacterium]|nr:hypothetical protein [Cellulomonadaceae bacterium]